MKLKQKIPLWAVRCVGWGAVFALTISCKREDPCKCADCGAPIDIMTYKFSIENTKADVDATGDALVIEGIKGAPIICYQQSDSYYGKLKVTYLNGQTQPYKYRVWGKIYNCDNCEQFIAGPNYHIKIDKIEYQN